EEDDSWILSNGQIQLQQDDKDYQISNFERKKVKLPERPEDFLVPVNESAEQSLTDLYQEIDRADADHQKRTATTNFLGRISYIFLGIPLLLLGLPILLYSYRKWG